MRFVGDIAEDAEVRAIASGAITDGEPVIVNSTGTVSGVTDAISLTLGSETEYSSDASNYNRVAFDSNSNRIVIAHKNGSNSNGTATVGSVSGTSVTFGTTVAFDSSGEAEFYGIAFDSNSNKIVIAYRDTTDSNKGKAVVGTVDPSDNSISFGSEATFTTNNAVYIDACFDSSTNKVVISYTDFGNSGHGTAVVATVSGTSISFGTPVVFNSANTAHPRCVYDSDEQRVVFGYIDLGNSYNPSMCVGTVSGTSISIGSEIRVSVTGGDYVGLAYDSTNQVVVMAYHDDSNSSYGTAVVGDVNNTEFNALGTPVVFESADNQYIDAVFDASVGKVVIAYRDVGNSNAGTYVVGTVGASRSISFTTPATFNTNTEYIGLGYDSNAERVVISYKDAGDGDDGTARILQNAQPTTLTTENFIGFAHAAYADGQKATVKTTGSIARNIPQIATTSSTVGTEVVFESATTAHKGIAFDSSNNRIVIAYRDGGNSNYGTAVVGTVSGTSISFGTPVTFDTGGAIDPIAVGFDSNSNKVVIAYRDGGDSDKGKAIVGTVDSSDNSITFGSEAEFNGGNTGYINVVFDSSNNKIVIAYTDYGNSSYGTAIVGTVSGTSISFGSEVVFESAASYYVGASFDSSNNKIVVAYSDDGNSGHGTAIVGTVSGTSISFGTAAVFNAANTTSGFPNNFPVVFDSSNNKIVIAYADEGAGGDGFAIVGTVSGTSISFGSEVEFHNDDIYGVAGVFDPSSNKVVISYGDENNSTHGKFILGTVSGTSISFETAATFASATTTYLVSTIDTNSNRVVIAYHDTGNSNYGTAIVIAPAGQGEDLTIGQQYFVQTDGTLGTSADDPSVIAGTAIGTSDIIVKG